MNPGLAAETLLMLVVALAPMARAEPPPKLQFEINFLLGFVEASGCQFYRNGSWYDSKAAQKHLREKYDFLKLKNQINTTEQFIDRAATLSSLSGLQYEVRCNGGETITSSQWLRNELAQFRAMQ